MKLPYTRSIVEAHLCRTEEELVPIGDDELVQSISIILAAHGDQFQQLKGKAVSPERRDELAQVAFSLTPGWPWFKNSTPKA